MFPILFGFKDTSISYLLWYIAGNCLRFQRSLGKFWTIKRLPLLNRASLIAWTKCITVSKFSLMFFGITSRLSRYSNLIESRLNELNVSLQGGKRRANCEESQFWSILITFCTCVLFVVGLYVDFDNSWVRGHCFITCSLINFDAFIYFGGLKHTVVLFGYSKYVGFRFWLANCSVNYLRWFLSPWRNRFV